MKIKKALKVSLGFIIFLTLPSALFFGYLLIKYNEDIPVGIKGIEADALANKMLDALNHDAYDATNYIEWTHRNKRHYKWEKNRNICTVYWKEYKVILHLKAYDESKAFVHNFEVKGEQAKELTDQAVTYFNNDSFWLSAPYKVFDNGTIRQLVKDENNKDALLVTYTIGGNTPGDSYLWLLQSNGKPYSFKMWTSLLPLDGVPATWNDWTKTESGAILPTHHKVLFFNIDLGEVKALIR